MQQLEAQTKSFQAMTERLSSNIMADFEVMLQKQLSSSIEGYDGFRLMCSVKRVCYHPWESVTSCLILNWILGGKKGLLAKLILLIVNQTLRAD